MYFIHVNKPLISKFVFLFMQKYMFKKPQISLFSILATIFFPQ